MVKLFAIGIMMDQGMKDSVESCLDALRKEKRLKGQARMEEANER